MRLSRIVPLCLMIVGFAVLSSVVGAQDAKPEKPAKEAKAAKAMSLDPYPLSICPVSKGKLGSMGDPVVYEHEGREIRFCCKGCVPKFEKDPAPFLAAIDEMIIEQQAPHYPTKKCVVSNEPLSEDGSEPVDIVHGNRLVRLCCKGCKKDFAKEPEAYLAKLDADIVAHGKKHYPLTTCVVSGEKLGSMGQPVNVVVANRLVKLCCKGCKKALLAEPAKYLAMLDEDHKGKGKKMKEGESSGKKKGHGTDRSHD